MVIFLTGATSTDDKIHGLNLGAADYVTKPFDAAELRARVRVALRMKYLVDLLEKKAMVDGLTGLWNRGYLDQRLRSEVANSRRMKHPLSLIIVDCDRFKSINDRFGHPFGDQVLRTLGALMSGDCRADDILCRYGGEEFAIVTPGVGAAGAVILAERIRKTIESHVFEPQGETIQATCSLGVAELKDVNDQEVQPFLAAADKALYQAKQNGRNRVVIADKETSPAVKAA
jgi:two-component system cell cycle response regulator